MSEHVVAGPAEQSSNSSGLMVMIDAQSHGGPCGPLTDGADAALEFFQAVVVAMAEPVDIGHVGGLCGFLSAFLFGSPMSGASRAGVRRRAAISRTGIYYLGQTVFAVLLWVPLGTVQLVSGLPAAFFAAHGSIPR